VRVAINATFADQETTGSGQYLRQLLPAMAPLLGSDELVCVTPKPIGDVGSLADVPRRALGTPFDGIHRGLAKVWFEQIGFPSACGDAKADVAHVPYFGSPLRAPCPVVVTIHDVIPLRRREYANSPAVRAYMRLVSHTARQACLVLTDSQHSARDIRQLLGIAEGRLRVVPLAAGEAFRPQTESDWAPTVRELGIERPYLLYLGGFDRRKRVPELLRAFADAERALTDLDLVIAGRPPQNDTLLTPDPRRIVSELGLNHRVRFLGWVAEEAKPALYAGARALLFPSVYEGFGLPVLESLACGTPAVVTSGSSLEEVGGDGVLLTPPDDANALARAIIQISRDDTLRSEMSVAGLAHTRTFSWERTARATRDAYLAAREGGLGAPPTNRLAEP